jgi:hypothetical protein
VASGGSVTGWTFGAFTDPDGRIASYSATLVTVTGSGSLSGTGLGPYSITGTADGDAYTVELDALDGDGGVLATAVHTVAIAQAALALTSALIFDGVDNYLEVAPVGSVPAELQFADTDPFTIAMWVSFDDTGVWQAGSWTNPLQAQGYALGVVNNSVRLFVRGASNLITCDGPSVSNTKRDTYWFLMGVYDGSGGLSVYVPQVQAAAYTASGTPGTIDYSSSATMIGTRLPGDPTNNVLNGRIGQVGIWSTDEGANISDIYAGGAIIDWSTLTNPPDALHFKIESTDDPTISGGIADSSGNGLDGTMQNAVAGDLVTVTPGWSA